MPWRRLLPFVCLYVSFGATLGFLGGGAPIILRERGVALAHVGLLQLIYLPLGLTFLWAGVLDKVRLPFLSRRVGWIVVTQVCGVALLLLLIAGETWPVAVLFLIAVAISFAFATMDIALEALVVDTVIPQARPAVTTAKLCGASIGGMLGTGLLAITYDRLGWHGSFAVVAVLDAVCLLPLLAYPEDRLRVSQPMVVSSGFARVRRLTSHTLLIGFYFAASGLLLTSNSLVLLDLHVPLAEVGFVVGTLGPAINLAVTVLAGALMAKIAAWRLVAAATLGVAGSGVLLVAATASGSARLGVVAVILGAVAASTLGVPVFTIIYRWSQSGSVATDYSLLFGIGFLAAMPARVGGPALAQALGWPGFFAMATPAYALSLMMLGAAMRKTEKADREGIE